MSWALSLIGSVHEFGANLVLQYHWISGPCFVMDGAAPDEKTGTCSLYRRDHDNRRAAAQTFACRCRIPGQGHRRFVTRCRFVPSTVSQTIESNAPLVAKASVSTDQVATPPRNKSDYSVGVQTLGASDEERNAMNDRLSADGYGLDPLTWSYPAGQRPSWFADRSTVFYYAPSAQSAAEQLARFMKTVTGQEFVVRRGAGLGVEPSRKNVTLFVHYIKT